MKRLNVVELPSSNSSYERVKRIVRSYDNLVIRLYTSSRFRIISSRFLSEFSQYMPPHGEVLDLGCGFGLFTIYFAMAFPDVHFTGVDRSRSRINLALKSARSLNVENVDFVCADVRDFRPTHQKYDLILTLDLMHHLAYEDGDSLTRSICYEWLKPAGVFLMKDVTTRPRPMLYFTFILDLLMNPSDAFYYRSVEKWVEMLRLTGFDLVEKHFLWDVLPYPHILLISRKMENAGA